MYSRVKSEEWNAGTGTGTGREFESRETRQKRTATRSALRLSSLHSGNSKSVLQSFSQTDKKDSEAVQWEMDSSLYKVYRITSSEREESSIFNRRIKITIKDRSLQCWTRAVTIRKNYCAISLAMVAIKIEIITDCKSCYKNWKNANTFVFCISKK